MFGNLCALQRQASHFLSVLQASRQPAAPPVANAAAPQDEHAGEEKTVKQMAERIIQTHKYGTLILKTTCQICTDALGQNGDTELVELGPSSDTHGKPRQAEENQHVHMPLLQCLLADADSHVCAGKHSLLRQSRDTKARPLTPRGRRQEAMRPTLQPCGHCRCIRSSPAMPLRTQAAHNTCLVSTSSAAPLMRCLGIIPALTLIDASCRLSQRIDSLLMQPSSGGRCLAVGGQHAAWQQAWHHCRACKERMQLTGHCCAGDEGCM